MPGKSNSLPSNEISWGGKDDYVHDPAAAVEFKTLGNSAFKAKDYYSAVEFFAKAIGSDKGNNVYYSNRAAAYAALGQWKFVESDAKKCVSLAPRWVKGYLRLAGALHELEDFKGAVKAYKTAIALPDATGSVGKKLTAGLKVSEAALDAQKKKNALYANNTKHNHAAKQEDEGKEGANTTETKADESTEMTADNYVIGIDLGTTYSCVSIWQNGKAHVIVNPETGKKTTASWVAFTESGRVVGDAAKQQAARNANRTLFNIKRLIGREFTDCYDDTKRMPFDVHANDAGKPVIEIPTFKEGEANRKFFPEQVSAMVLERMKAVAEQYLGCPVHKAVVTVPAYFNDAQRRLTKDAGTIAGLEVLRIINEPTAAALAYGLHQKGKQNVLVFDLGGGTFDVSLLNINDGMFEVLATAGDTHLGGEDFDVALADWAVQEWERTSGESGTFNTDKDKRRLRTACEKAKRLLSVQNTATIDCFAGESEVSVAITRDQFNKIQERIFQRCMRCVKQVLMDSKIPKENVNEIVLVGGSTRIPRVREILSEYFGGKQLCHSVNPDEAVAYGAAVQAAILAGVRDEVTTQLLLVDVVPLSLGVEMIEKRFGRVVPRNTSIPCKRTSEFTTTQDWQTTIDMGVYEGERDHCDGNHLLGEFNIAGIERAKKGVPKIEVTFEVNTNGLLTVSARDKVTGAKAQVEIQHDVGRLDDREIEMMVAEAAKLREEDKAKFTEQFDDEE